MAQDKRIYKRVEFREPVKYQVVSPPDLRGSHLENFGGFLSLDLSEGGIRFRANDFLPLAAKLSLEISLERDQLLGLDGQVVWMQKLPHSEQYLFGLHFSDTPENAPARKTLHEFFLLNSN